MWYGRSFFVIAKQLFIKPQKKQNEILPHTWCNPKFLESTTQIAGNWCSENFSRVFSIHQYKLLAFFNKSSFSYMANAFASEIFRVKANFYSLSFISIC